MKATLYNLFLLLLISQSCFGQGDVLPDSLLNRSTVIKIRFAGEPKCDSIDMWAKSDIKNKTIFLFLQSGEAPIVYTNDKIFETKYGIYFQDFGDIGFADYTCVIKYNNIVFDYLTNKYGRRWVKEIRKDVIGFKYWKKTKK